MNFLQGKDKKLGKDEKRDDPMILVMPITLNCLPSGIWLMRCRPPSCVCLPGEYREDRFAFGLRVPAPVSRQRLHYPKPPAALAAG